MKRLSNQDLGKFPFSMVYYILIISILFDIFLYFWGESSLFIISRGLIFAFVILMIHFKYIKFHKFLFWVYLFIFYVAILFPFSSNTFESIRLSSKVFISLLMLPVGYYFFSNLNRLKKLSKTSIVLLVILVANYLLSSYLDIGFAIYSKGTDFQVGNLRDNWNIFTYTVFCVPLYLFFESKRWLRIFTLILSTFVIIILLLSMKRIAILGFFFGIFIYFISSPSFSRIRFLKTVSLLLIIIIIAYPLYNSLLKDRFEIRKNKFTLDVLNEEKRYIETKYVWQECLSFENIGKSFFGLEAFYSVGNYLDGYWEQRPVHVDYNLVLNTTGILGLFLYIMMYIQIFKKYKRSYKRSKDNISFKLNENILKPLFFVLFFTSLFTSLSGQMIAITFRSIIFLYIGAILRVFYETSKLGSTEKVKNPQSKII
jgi:hypothetical protein